MKTRHSLREYSCLQLLLLFDLVFASSLRRVHPNLSSLINEKVHSLDEEMDLFHGNSAFSNQRNYSTFEMEENEEVQNPLSLDNLEFHSQHAATNFPSSFSSQQKNSSSLLDTSNKSFLIRRKQNTTTGFNSHRLNGKRPVFLAEDDHVQKPETDFLNGNVINKSSTQDLQQSMNSGASLLLPPKLISSSTLEVHGSQLQNVNNLHRDQIIESSFVQQPGGSNGNNQVTNVVPSLMDSLNVSGQFSGVNHSTDFSFEDLNNANNPGSTMSPNVNYNQQDPLNPLQIIAHPIQNLVLRSFEGYRRLMKNTQAIEAYIINRLNLPKWTTIRRLDPLNMPEPLFFEHRDPKTPMIGKLKFTFESVQISGLSNFKVENLSNQGRTLFFKHRIPQLDSLANYTVDYHLFDEIPLRISEGQLKASVPNAYIKGSFQVLPDILNVWFKVANLNLTGWIDDIDMHVFPNYVISDRFKVERSTINKMNAAVRAMMPDIVEFLKITYNKAIELKMV